MNRLKKYILSKLTVVDVVEYFYSKGVHIYLQYRKKPRSGWYAKNSRLYRVKK